MIDIIKTPSLGRLLDRSDPHLTASAFLQHFRGFDASTTNSKPA
ncbi:hypothetical protein [Variovorax arabinosiphilus]|nr:hypothetical protein [Variovorax sp. J2R1-6]MDM0232821.1 hypothetical protein [Variovorax sp. J2R1-6]